MATLVTRSGKGSPLTHAEVDANFTNLNTDKLELSGGTMTGNLSFGDNDKAIFGAGSDLQIYHDGADSVIADVGTGNLSIQGTNLRLRNADNTADYITCNDGGDVKLKYANANKLVTTSTGIDVTGTVTADGLTVDGDVTINSTFPRIFFYESDTTDLNSTIKVQNGSLLFQSLNDDGSGTTSRMAINNSTGDISFYEDTGTTAKFFWDASAESLGIGAGDVNLSGVGVGGFNTVTTIQGNNQFRGILELANSTGVSSAGASAGDIAWFDNDNKIAQISGLGQDTTNHDDGELAFSTTSGGTLSERMRISSGNVGIGTSSPSQKLEVSDTTNQNVVVRVTNNDGNAEMQKYQDDLYLNLNDTGNIIVRSGSPIAERMRIDSSGRLLVGKTVNDNTTDGISLRPEGELSVVNTLTNPAGGAVAVFNRKSADGTILQLRKDGSTVGSIGATGGRLYIGDGTVALRIVGDADEITPWNATANTNRDAAIALGNSTNRFTDLYLSGGVVFGGTGGSVTSRTLDDYEEGVWTPVAAGDSSSGTASYSIQSGNYTKIGNMVYIMGRLGWTGHTGSGNLIVNGLPFSSNNQYAFLGFNFRDFLTITAGKTAHVYVKPSSATAAFIEIGTGTSATSGVSMDTAVVDVSFSGFYRVS